MSRYYAHKSGRSRLGALCQTSILATFLVALGSACASAPAKAPRAPAPDIVALSDKAEAAERKREHLQAEAYLQEAIEQAKDPVSAAYANRKMASMLLFWREEARARAYLQASLEHDASQAAAWNDLGVVESNLGHPHEARQALEKAVELAPKEPRARLALGAELVKQKEYKLALAQYKVLLTLRIPAKIEDATHRAIKLLESELARETDEAPR